MGLGLMALLIAGLIYALFHAGDQQFIAEDAGPPGPYSAIARPEGAGRSFRPRKGGEDRHRPWPGPSAFFYKHLLENRRARLFVLDTTSLIFLATTLVFAFFLREAGIFPIFLFSPHMQVFSSMGRWLEPYGPMCT